MPEMIDAREADLEIESAREVGYAWERKYNATYDKLTVVRAERGELRAEVERLRTIERAAPNVEMLERAAKAVENVIHAHPTESEWASWVPQFLRERASATRAALASSPVLPDQGETT